VSLLAKKAGAANRRNVKARAKKVSKKEKMKKESDVQVPVKGKANKKATDKKEKRSVRTAAGKEKPKKSFFQNITRFFQSVWGELKKVHWPGRNQLIAYSAVVVVAVIIVAFLIWIADILISWVVQLLLSL
jgi:preprotein translocase subunit SecE